MFRAFAISVQYTRLVVVLMCLQAKLQSKLLLPDASSFIFVLAFG